MENIWHIIGALFCILVLLVGVHEFLKKRKKPTQLLLSGCTSNQSCTFDEEEITPLIDIEQKDSIDEHLEVLTKKLADKEGRLKVSKSKIRQTQNEIENLNAIDIAVQKKYREIMENLKRDLKSNEKDCKQLQEQIEWVSRRRAELREEVIKGQNMYSQAVTGLARGIREVSKQSFSRRGGGGAPMTEAASDLWAAFEKQERSCCSLRSRPSPGTPRRDDSNLKKSEVGTDPLAGMPRFIR